MTTDTTDRQLVWVVLAIVTVLLVLPALGMGVGMMGAGPMMDGTWGGHMWGASGASGWMLLLGVAGHEGETAPSTVQPFENWERVIDVNLQGVFLGMRYEIPAILQSGGGAIEFRRP